MIASKEQLVKFAVKSALQPLHGFINGEENIKQLIDLFPKWNVNDADKYWCAAFVYYCCIKSGFIIPYSPNECITCSLAGCGGWEEFALGDKRIKYIRPYEGLPKPGDIVLYDNVFENKEHDHIGIIVEVTNEYFMAAEGNNLNTNCSSIEKRKYDEHIRSYIRIPDGFTYYNFCA